MKNPAYETELTKVFGLPMTCNCCDRTIFEDETDAIRNYPENGGYCPECESEQEIL